jgi:exopolysaccharide transport family protein
MESVKQKPGTRILEISITSVDPAKAAKIANELVDVYIASQIEAKFEATREANVWLAKRIDELGQQLQESERVVESYRAANGLQGSGGVTLNDQQLSELNAQLILARADAAAKQAKYDRARQILAGKGSIESVTDVLQSSTIAALRAKEAELAREQADLSTKYGPRHPSILNIEAQRRDTSRQISVEIQRIVGGISNEVAVADSRVKALQDSLNQLQDRAGANNQAAVKLRELDRQAAANRTVYEAFLNRFKETGQQQGLQTADSRVIQQAIVPTGPSYPKTTKILLGAVAASLMVGLGIAILLELLDNGITTPMQVETALGLPLLVSVPLIPVEKGADGKPMGPTEYVVRKPLSAYSEAMRSMRSTLALSNVDSPPKVILFTSSLPEEGKTTTSASFAREAALSGKRVLLIDCDLRHPSVHKALLGNATPKFGLVELLAGSCKMEEAVMCDTESGLDFLPVVIGAVNPPDILGSAQMRSLVAKCRERYDLVIIDSPPVMPVVDSRVLGHVADKTVFVVRWQKTPLDAARIAIRELRHANVDVVGAVLSLVDTVSQAKYGYGASGYYYGRYTRYYSN